MEAAVRVKWWLQKIHTTILKAVTCLGFSNIEEFTEVTTLAASGGLKTILSSHVVHTEIFV